MGRQFVGPGLECVVGLVSEDKTDVLRFIPPIQVLGLGELGVAPHQDLAEARPAAQRDRLVQEDVRLFLGGAVAAAIEQKQRFGGIGQRDHQRMVAILAVVGEVHVALALGIAGHDAAIGLEDRLGEEFGWLLGPDPQPRLIDRVHQREDIGLGEATAEVAGSGRVGDAFGPQGVEVDLVVAPQFEVLDAQAAGEDIEGDVQDVVGFVVGEMPLEEVELVVDLPDESDLLSQEEDGPDAAGTEPAGAPMPARSGYWWRSSWVQAARVRAYWRAVSGSAAAPHGRISSCVPPAFFGE